MDPEPYRTSLARMEDWYLNWRLKNVPSGFSEPYANKMFVLRLSTQRFAPKIAMIFVRHVPLQMVLIAYPLHNNYWLN